jgi:hypothetical protein
MVKNSDSAYGLTKVLDKANANIFDFPSFVILNNKLN